MATNGSADADSPRSASAERLRLRGDGDRGCRHCGAVALVFDPGTGGARCRACGERD